MTMTSPGRSRLLTLRSPAAKLWFHGIRLSGQTITMRGIEYAVTGIQEYSWHTAMHVELQEIRRRRP